MNTCKLCKIQLKKIIRFSKKQGVYMLHKGMETPVRGEHE